MNPELVSVSTSIRYRKIRSTNFANTAADVPRTGKKKDHDPDQDLQIFNATQSILGVSAVRFGENPKSPSELAPWQDELRGRSSIITIK